MRSSRWDAQGNIYLVTEEPLTADSVRAEVGDADGILEVLGAARLARDRDLEPRRLAGGDVGQRHAHRRTLARRSRPAQRRSWCASGHARSSARMLADGLRRAGPRRGRVCGPEEVAGVRFVAVDVGNPHAVVDGDPADLPRIGPLLETHERFPNRTNVQVARVVGDRRDRGARLGARRGGDGLVGLERGRGRGGVRHVAGASIRFPGGELHVRFEGDAGVPDRARRARLPTSCRSRTRAARRSATSSGRWPRFAADDQRAREVVRPGRKLLRPRARHDDRRAAGRSRGARPARRRSRR